MPIYLFDTSVGTENMGDHIIMDAVTDVLIDLFPMEHAVTFSSHWPNRSSTYRNLKDAPYCFVGGTNLLSPKRHIYARKNLWAVSFTDLHYLAGKALLLGVGAQKDAEGVSAKSRNLYRALLSKGYQHSVRDGMTLDVLKSIGIQNVINTGCPTTWKLTPAHCQLIPQHKAGTVVFTLTKYWQDLESDRHMVEVLLKLYDKVIFWPQGIEDLEYLHRLMPGETRIEVLPVHLKNFDHLLESQEVDYVGTRLHAGIRALQKKRRSLIVAVDNRAREISRDIGLKILLRKDMNQMEGILSGSFATDLTVDYAAIDKWKSQFKADARP